MSESFSYIHFSTNSFCSLYFNVSKVFDFSQYCPKILIICISVFHQSSQWYPDCAVHCIDCCITTLIFRTYLYRPFTPAAIRFRVNFDFSNHSCPPVVAPLQDCERVENVPLPEEDRGEEVHPAGDLPEVLQDVGEQMEDRTEEEIPPGTSPPQVPLKPLPQLSAGDGESLVSHIQLMCRVAV